MTNITFARRGLRSAGQTFDGDMLAGQVFAYTPWWERLSRREGAPHYLAMLPSGRWLPGVFFRRHDAAEALRAHCRLEQYEDLDLHEESPLTA